jgi:hypothetical protein
VSKEFSTIIRNRLKSDEFRDAYFMDTPEYVLMRLDPFWEKLVENALYKSPLLSSATGNSVNNLGPDSPREAL